MTGGVSTKKGEVRREPEAGEFLMGMAEHFPRHVESGAAGDAGIFCKGDEDIGGSGGQVKYAKAMALGEVFYELLAPGGVASQGKELIDQVVTVRDPVEHFPDMFTGGPGVLLVCMVHG